MAKKSQTSDLDKTISILQDDLTSISAEEAIVIIEGWQKQLAGTPIAEDLEELKSALETGEEDAEKIAELLANLGEEAMIMADSDDLSEDVAEKVELLGELLSEMSDSDLEVALEN
jgi:hypothetical protein